MDPITAVGLAASICQLIDVTTKTLGWLNDVKKAPEERATLAIEMTSLLVLLTSMRYKVESCKPQGSWFAAVRFLGVNNGPLDQLASTILNLQKRMGADGGLQTARNILRWPYTQKEVRTLLSQIERLKSLINLAFQKDISDLILAIKADVEIASALDDDMKKLARRVEAMRSLQDSTVHQAEKARLTEQRARVIEWASPLRFEAIQSDTLKKRQEGTCEWILNSKPFTKWVATSGTVLWCPGIPGAGKTVFTAVGVDHMRQQQKTLTSQRIGIAVVYCNYKEGYNHTVVNLLAAIWRQFVESGNRPLTKSMLLSHRTHADRKTTLDLPEISKELQFEVRRHHRCYIFVDALDECPEAGGQRARLVHELRALLPRANLLFTSRPLDSIRIEMRSGLRLEISASADDVAKYVRHRIATEDRLRRHVSKDPALENEIVSRVLAGSEKMFLLPQLQMDSLATQGTRRALENALVKLPQELDEIYEDALSRIEKQHEFDRDLAFKIISFISFACRPLGREELQHALAVEIHDKMFDEKNVPDEDMLTSICAGLIIIESARDVFVPIHYTTQEYFERIRSRKFPLAQSIMTRVCLTYLSFDDLCQTNRAVEQEAQSRANQTEITNFSFVPYAARYWIDHYKSNISEQEDTDGLLWRFLRKKNNFKLAVEQYQLFEATYIPPGADSVQVAVLLGHLSFVQRLIKTGANLKHRNKYGSVALHLAILSKNNDIIQCILKHTRDVNIQDWWGRSPLLHAARNGNDLLVKQLLQLGANWELKDEWGSNVLHYASMGGNDQLVTWIIEKFSPDVDEQDRQGITSLSYAAKRGRSAVAKVLLDLGANPNIREFEDRVDSQRKKRLGRTALHRAAASADDNLIDLLLKAGADIDAIDGDGYSALHEAILSQNAEAAEALLRGGCSRDSSAFESTARTGNTEMMALMLDYCRDIDISSALSIAASDEKMTRVLLNYRPKANIDTEDGYGKSPLHLATEAGSSKTVSALIAQGANLEHRNGYGETALHRAAENGYTNIVRLLLEAGAHVNALDIDMESPLHRAAATEQIEVIRILLKHSDIKPDMQDHNGVTPLHRAAKSGNRKLIEMLITHKTPLRRDPKDNNDLTPRDWAVDHGFSELGSLLSEM